MPSISPGPNVYDLPKIIGPGTHDPRFPAAPAYTLSPRIEGGNLEQGPGPTTYQYGNVYRDGKTDAKAFSLGGRAGAPPKDLSPGPGQYDPTKAEKLTFKHLPVHGFGEKEKVPRKDQSPAPGQYDPRFPDNTKTFAMRGRPRSRRNDASPGPGTYEVTPRVQKDGVVGGPQVSLTGRGSNMAGSSTPAPGQYEMEKGFNATHRGLPTYSFKGKGREFAPGDTPGPTAYNPRLQDSKRTFTMGGRERDWRGSDTPGPGQYEFDNHVFRTGRDGGKPVTIKGRPRDQTVVNNLGPGSYTPDFSQTQTRLPNYSMGGRSDYKNEDLRPGPGHYDPKDRHNPQGFQFRGRPGDGGHGKSPGPGAYEIHDRMHYKGPLGGPSYTMGGRDGATTGDGAPGPGHYEPKHDPTKPRQPTYSFTPRGEMAGGSTTPGPGYYTPRDAHGGTTFALRGRPKDDLKDNRPAPGQYEVGDVLYNKGKVNPRNFTMGKKGSDNRSSTYPGPGHYDPADNRGGPKWSLGARQAHTATDASPGPGYYDPRDGNRVKALSMDATGNDKRNLYGNSQTPGPGYYQVDNSVYDKTGKKQPAFSMGGRDPAQFGSGGTPGPGHYLPDINKDARDSKGPAYSLGGRGAGQTSDGPGPGYYDPDPMIGKTVRSNKPTLPQFSMHKRDITPGRDASPGPGQYETADTNLYKSKPPAFSMGLKNRDGDVNLTPRATKTQPAAA